MNKIKSLALCMICGLTMSAQTVLNTGYLQITLNRNVLKQEGGVCVLDSVGDIVYIHSGAGYRSNTSVWDAVVGNWGYADGIGEMHTVSDTIQTICMNLTSTNNYFQNPATYNVDSGPLPVGANVYNIGCVFRAPSGFQPNPGGGYGTDRHLKGAGPTISAVSNDCEDIYLLGVNSDSIGYQVQPILVVGENYDPVPAVTPTWVSQSVCAAVNGVQDISGQLFDGINAFPNPFSNDVSIQFNMVPDVSKVRAEVYDVLGRKVADFSNTIRGGYNSFSWDGTGMDGSSLAPGTYLLKVTNGRQVQTKKLIKK